MKLTKEQFVKYVNKLDEMSNQESKIIEALGNSPEWIPSFWIENFYQLLKEMCEVGDEYETALDAFVYDLDFGRDYESNMITDELTGEEVDMSTAEKVYDIIVKDYKTNNKKHKRA